MLPTKLNAPDNQSAGLAHMNRPPFARGAPLAAAPCAQCRRPAVACCRQLTYQQRTHPCVMTASRSAVSGSAPRLMAPQQWDLLGTSRSPTLPPSSAPVLTSLISPSSRHRHQRQPNDRPRPSHWTLDPSRLYELLCITDKAERHQTRARRRRYTQRHLLRDVRSCLGYVHCAAYETGN